MQTGAAAEIVFDHVTKRYAGRDQPAVNDLSLTIPAGVTRASVPGNERR